MSVHDLGVVAERIMLILDMMPPLGVEPAAALQRAGLSRATLSEPSARLLVQEEQRLWDAIESLADDPAFGLRLGKHYVHAGLPGIEGYLGRHAATLRSSLLISDRYAQITDERARLSLLEVDDLVTVRIFREGAAPRALGFMEALLATMNTFATELVDGYTLRAVSIRRTRPASIEPYLETFGVLPSFDAEHHELVFARELLDCPVRGADLELGRILQQHLSDLLARARPSDPLLSRLRSELTRRLEGGSLELPSIASALAMTERTLRRRLAERDTSYQNVLDELRSELACQLLQQNRPIRAVALSLGFRSVSSFQKAFARWKGVPPSEYRKGPVGV